MRATGAVLLVLAGLVAAAPAHADWARAALADQYELGAPLPLRNAPWVGTHNSFNSAAEMGPTLSNQDANQKIALVDQLDAGVRSIELDVHYFPSLSGGGLAPVVCHATEEHAGCSAEKTLDVVLDEVAGWLREHRDQMLLLYLEDHLDSEAGHEAAARVLEDKLGEVIARPPPAAAGADCAPLGLDDTRAGVRRNGDQVIVVSGCGPGAGWPRLVYDWSKTHEEDRPRGYEDFPGCGPDFSRADYDTELIRYFEDSTRLTAGGSMVGQAELDDGITAQTAGAMMRCGVDLLGLDQLERDDARFAALVWSWAPDQPRRPGCAAQYGGRWYSLRCTRRLRTACLTRDGRWRVPHRAVRRAEAGKLCRRAEGTFAVPRTGYEAQRLRVAMERVGAARAWVRFTSG